MGEEYDRIVYKDNGKIPNYCLNSIRSFYRTSANNNGELKNRAANIPCYVALLGAINPNIAAGKTSPPGS